MSFFRVIAAFCGSSIGRKILVAVTGLGLLLFLAGHLVGNLLIYLGPDAINSYAYELKHALHGGLLWGARIGLLVFFVVHIVFTIKLTQENRSARQDRYEHGATVQASTASRSMILSGLVVLSFLIYHLLHFTIQATGVEAAPLPNGQHDVYSMVVAGFSNPLVSGFYILSMALLCAHLSHGFSSVFQTLGLSTQRTKAIFKTVGIAYALVIFVGNISIPISVLTGFVKPIEAATANL